MLNICIFEGHLTKDPEQKVTPRGLTITTITVAVNDAVKKNGETRTLFIPCTFFGSQAENVARYFRKGKAIQVFGMLRCDEITSKDNPLEKKEYWYLNAQKFEFPISEKNKMGYSAPAPLPQAPKQDAVEQNPSNVQSGFESSALSDLNDDDLPF